MKVKKFYEIVLQTLGASNNEFKIDGRVIIGIAELLVSTYIKEELVDKGKPIPSGYFRTFTMKVINSGGGKRKYIEFDPPVMSVGDNDGLSFVGSTGDELNINSSYVMLKTGQLSSGAGLEAQALGGRPAVRMEGGDKGYLYNEPLLLDEVSVMMIPQLTELEDDDEMFGSGEVGQFILEKCILYLQKKASEPEDKKTDNQSK